MALKSTIYKVQLHVADLDREYYQSRQLTIARHPSENDQRLAVRLLAFAKFCSDELALTRGLCADDEPELWEKDLSGRILHWIELGTPAEDRLRKACNRAELVTVLAYGDRSASAWWEKNRQKLARFSHLQVFFVADSQAAALAERLQRNLEIQVTTQGEEMWLVIDGHTLTFALEHWK